MDLHTFGEIIKPAQWRFPEERDLTCPVTLEPVHNIFIVTFHVVN